MSIYAELKVLSKSVFYIKLFCYAFYQFCLRIWNQCKTLRFLEPILTYFKNEVFSSIFGKLLIDHLSFLYIFFLGREWRRGTRIYY